MELTPVSPGEVRSAARRIRRVVLRTPLVRLNHDADASLIYLKLESLQPVGSFKLRGASNAMALLRRDDVGNDGVWTASAGNMGQAVAWCSQRLDVPCSVVVPDHAPAIKLSGIERLGARTVKVPFAAFAEILGTHHMDGMTGRFLHPFADRNVMAGNGTIGLEILEDLPAVDAVIVPYGGGGLLCGIAAAIHSVAPHVRVYACEIETAAPFAASLAAGRAVEVQRRTSFVDGIGAPRVFGEMFSLAQRLATGSQVVSLEAVARAIRLLAERNHIVAEGAGAASVAVALTGRISGPRIACIVSGGNLDVDVFRGILAGHPQEGAAGGRRRGLGVRPISTPPPGERHAPTLRPPEASWR